ncbi:MAG: hypothetical protein J6Q85_01145 [Clostridia bacterium]|nr:hypothetical protein [Clostridia bacterium]
MACGDAQTPGDNNNGGESGSSDSQKLDITGITDETEQTVKEDGQKHVPSYVGTIPAGVNVKYIFDGIDLTVFQMQANTSL